MKRRNFCIAASAITSLDFVNAQSLKKDEFKPYFEVSPIAGEEEKVRVYFSPSCSFSKQYFPFFKNLEGTLPANKQFAFTPLLNKTDGVAFGLAFCAISHWYPKYVNNFVEASLEGVQNQGQTVRNWQGIDRIGQAARLPVSAAKLTKENLDQAIFDTKRLIEIQSKCGIKNTPAVAVAGTYWVTPEITNGDSVQFNQLVNALISMTSS